MWVLCYRLPFDFLCNIILPINYPFSTTCQFLASFSLINFSTINIHIPFLPFSHFHLSVKNMPYAIPPSLKITLPPSLISLASFVHHTSSSLVSSAHCSQMSRSSFTIPLSCHHLWTHALPSPHASISSSYNVLHPGSLFIVTACLVNTFMDSTVSDTRRKHAYSLPMQSAWIHTPSTSIKNSRQCSAFTCRWTQILNM